MLTRRRLVPFACAVLIWNVIVITWGAFVRASGSGAGCGAHWPLCNGEVIPRSPRIETIIELGHRLTSGAALMLVAALCVFTFVAVPKGHAARKGAIASGVFILGEALIGAAIVLLGKVARDTSITRGPSAAMHLVNTFFLVAALAFTAWSASSARGPRYARHPGVAWALGATLLLVVLAGSAGAVAALGDTLWPASSLAEGMRQDVAPTAHLFLRVRALHPLFAVLAAVASFACASITTAVRGSREVARAASFVRLAVLAQMAAGVVNLLLLAPIAMQLVHLVLADALVVSLTLLASTSLSDVEGSDQRVAYSPSALGEGAG